MSAVLVIKLPDADVLEASRHASQTLKAVLAPLGDVEVFTFEEGHFDAHWKPLHEPLRPAAQPEMEHVWREGGTRRLR